VIRLLRAGTAALLLVAGCGESAVCGNAKVEDGEQCDDGNTVSGDGCSATCRVEATADTFIHWQFVVGQFDGFDGETCLGLGVSKVTLTLTGPKMVTETSDCGLSQIKLSSLPAGTYAVSAVALDANGATVTNGLASQTFTAGATQDVYVNFPFEDFTRAYTGTYYFSVRYGGVASCADAEEPVARERITMVRGGTSLPGMTLDGIPLDGSLAGACHSAGESAPQQVNDLAWGPATVTITGETQGGTVLYRRSFDTFVGAGIANTTAELDLTLVAPRPDAPPPSLDAPVAAIDAGASD
jgi:cysteine-rich repeat protein